MGKLIFKDMGKYWEAEATVNADYNIHVERVKSGDFVVEEATVIGGEKRYAYSSTERVIDKDFDSIVYPKYLRIRSFTEPKVAMLTEEKLVAGGGSGSGADTDAVSALQAEVAEIKARQNVVESAIPVEDADGNGIPDGIDRLNRIEAEMEGMTAEEVAEAWKETFEE